MRVTNIIREKIDRVLEKQFYAKVNELTAPRDALDKQLREELEVIVKEANEKADAVLAKAPAGSKFSRYGDNGKYITSGGLSSLIFPTDDEINQKIALLRERRKELALDMEIRCQLEKDADAFFKALAELQL